MLDIANQRYAALDAEQAQGAGSATRRRHRVVGVYVGWRGESLDVPLLRYTTVVDRKNAADRVAKGDVRELFAMLRKDQIVADRGRMRTIVIGHSFGGLIAFHGLSPALLNELSLTRPTADSGCVPAVQRKSRTPSLIDTKDPTTASAPIFPDMLILINPAFEATRFESLHDLMRPDDGCSNYYDAGIPKIVVITADNDRWTGSAYTFGRKLTTLLEAYPSAGDLRRSNEIGANTHAIGRVDRYRTHRLCLTKPDALGRQSATAVFVPGSMSDWPAKREAPIWVVGAPENIVDGHDGFLYARHVPSRVPQSYLLDWILRLNTGKTEYLAKTDPAGIEDSRCAIWPD